MPLNFNDSQDQGSTDATMTTSADLQDQPGQGQTGQGQIGSEERLTGDTTGPNKPGHVAEVHSTNGYNTNGNGNGNCAPAAPTRPWSLQDSARLYNIQQWGSGYFSINDD